MGTLAEISAKIGSLRKTKKMMQALKSVSIVKERLYSKQLSEVGEYIEGISQLFFEIYTSLDHSFEDTNGFLFGIHRREKVKAQGRMRVKPVFNPPFSKRLTIVVGSDLGMCSSFNSVLHESLRGLLEENKTDFIVYGNKIYSFFESHFPASIKKIKVFTRSEGRTLRQLKESAREVFKVFLYENYSHLDIIYLVDNQKGGVKKMRILPFTEDYFVNKRQIRSVVYTTRLKYPEIIIEMFPDYLEAIVMGGFLHSKSKEHALRRELVFGAEENTKELLKEKEMTFNKLRQAKITQEIVEIVSARQARGS